MSDHYEPSPRFVAEQATLRAGLEQSAQALDELKAKLNDVEARLAETAQAGSRYEALARLCASLEALDSAGASDLFWGESAGNGESSERIEEAYRRIDEFEGKLVEMQGQRKALAEQIGQQIVIQDDLDYCLSEALEEEEDRKAEWLVERDASKPSARLQVMPWARGFEEDGRFVRTLGITAAICLLLGLLVQFIDLPLPDRSKLTEVPERVAKLVELNRPKPIEVAEQIVEEAVPEELEEPEPEPDDEPVVAEEPVPELADQPAPQVAEVQPEDTREQVKSKGILAFRESFASRASSRPTAQLGSKARLSEASDESVGRPTRSMVTSNAPGSSGGINLASISRDVGGGASGAIGGVEVTQVASTIGGDGTSDRPLSGGPSAGRTDEEIQIVFDRYKAALYRLYNRELRKDPTLRGQLVLRLTIEPDGSVSFCDLQSSDMEAPTLEQQIVSRVGGFDFGAKEDILAMTIIYPIDFLPAS